MKWHGENMTSAAGSIAGVTYSRNRFGQYRRARAVPVNTNTTFQQQIRSALTELVTRWTETLTDAQRDAWAVYAANVPVIDSLGFTINLTGQNWYIASNAPRVQAVNKGFGALGIVDTAPVIFDRGTFTTPVITSDVSTGTTINTFDTDAWASDDAGAMLVFEGIPQNPSRNFFNGPFRLIAEIPGDSVTPPTATTITPAQIAARGYVYASTQKVWYAVEVLRGDGRLSTRALIETTAVP